MQRMYCAERDKGQSTFVLLTQKCARAKNQKEIGIRLVNKAASITCIMALLSNSNQPKALTKANNRDISNIKLLLAESKATDLDLSDDRNLMTILLAN